MKLVDPTELEKLNIKSVGGLANDRAKGRGLPYYRVGGRIKYDLEEVLNLIRVNPNGDKAA